jgi:CheY-specific phosphatase CheX
MSAAAALNVAASKLAATVDPAASSAAIPKGASSLVVGVAGDIKASVKPGVGAAVAVYPKSEFLSPFLEP